MAWIVATSVISRECNDAPHILRLDAALFRTLVFFFASPAFLLIAAATASRRRHWSGPWIRFRIHNLRSSLIRTAFCEAPPFFQLRRKNCDTAMYEVEPRQPRRTSKKKNVIIFIERFHQRNLVIVVSLTHERKLRDNSTRHIAAAILQFLLL